MLLSRSTSFRRRSPSSRPTGKIPKPIVHRRQSKRATLASLPTRLLSSLAQTIKLAQVRPSPRRPTTSRPLPFPLAVQMQVPRLRQSSTRPTPCAKGRPSTRPAARSLSPLWPPPLHPRQCQRHRRPLQAKHPLPRLQLSRSAARVDWVEASATERAARVSR